MSYLGISDYDITDSISTQPLFQAPSFDTTNYAHLMILYRLNKLKFDVKTEYVKFLDFKNCYSTEHI